MSDFEEKLNAILSNPDAMAQVMNLAQSLNLDGPSSGDSPGEEDNGGGRQTADSGSATGINDLLGQIDPQLIQRFLPLIGELKGGEEQDRRLQLLNALRPFLKPERQEKVERAMRAAKLLHLGKKFLSAMGESNV